MTQRSLAAATDSAIDLPYVIEIIFLEMLFDTDPVRVHTDIGTITADGRDASRNVVSNAQWQGVGDLGGVGTVEQGEVLSPFAVECLLSINSEAAGSILEEINTQDWRNRPANLYFGTRDYLTGAINDPDNLVPIFQGKIDAFETTDGQEISLASVRLESNLREFSKPSMLRFSDATQQRRYPGDLGMQYVAQMVNNTVRWGTDETISFGSRSGSSGSPIISSFF